MKIRFQVPFFSYSDSVTPTISEKEINKSDSNSKTKLIVLVSVLGVLLLLIGFITFKFLSIKPVNLRVSNVGSRTATISWVSKNEQVGTILVKEKGGITLPIAIKTNSSMVGYDNRDITNAELQQAKELSEQAKENGFSNVTQYIEEIEVKEFGKYYTHHIVVSNLEPEKEYVFYVGDSFFYTLNNEIDNNTSNFKTQKEPENVEAPMPAYGKILNVTDAATLDDAKPVTDGIVYMQVVDNISGTKSSYLSSSMNSNGGWYLDLSNLTNENGENFLKLLDGQSIDLDYNLIIETVNNGRWVSTLKSDRLAPAPVMYLDLNNTENTDNINKPVYEGSTINSSIEITKETYAANRDTCSSRNNASIKSPLQCVPNSYCPNSNSYGDCLAVCTDGGYAEEADCYMHESCTSVWEKRNCATDAGSGDFIESDTNTSVQEDNDPEPCPGVSDADVRYGSCEKAVNSKECLVPIDTVNGNKVCCDVFDRVQWVDGSSCSVKVPVEEETVEEEEVVVEEEEKQLTRIEEPTVLVCCITERTSGLPENVSEMITTKLSREGCKYGEQRAELPLDNRTYKRGIECTYNEMNFFICNNELVVTDRSDCNLASENDNVTGYLDDSDKSVEKNTEKETDSDKNISKNDDELKALEKEDELKALEKEDETKADEDKNMEKEKYNKGIDKSYTRTIEECGEYRTDFTVLGFTVGSNSLYRVDENGTVYYCSENSMAKEETYTWVEADITAEELNCKEGERCALPNMSCQNGNLECNFRAPLSNGIFGGYFWTDPNEGSIHSLNKDTINETAKTYVTEKEELTLKVATGTDEFKAENENTTVEEIQEWYENTTEPVREFIDNNVEEIVNNSIDKIIETISGYADTVEESEWVLIPGFRSFVIASGEKCETPLENGMCFCQTTYEFINQGDTCAEILPDNVSLGNVLGTETYAQTDLSGQTVLFTEKGVLLSVPGGLYQFDYEGESYFIYIEPEQSYNSDTAYLVYLDKDNNGTYSVDSDVLLSDLGQEVVLKQLTQNQPLALKRGYNFVSFPIYFSDEKIRTASGFVSEMNKKSNNAILQMGKYDGSWKVVGNNGDLYDNNDFQIIPGEGYVIKSSVNVTIYLDGYPIKYETSEDNLPIYFNEGWNLIGLYGSNTKSYTAETLIDDVNNYDPVDFTAVNVSKFDTSKQRYDGLQKETDESGVMEVYGFDFPLYEWNSYFVKIKEGRGIWKPELSE